MQKSDLYRKNSSVQPGKLGVGVVASLTRPVRAGVNIGRSQLWEPALSCDVIAKQLWQHHRRG